MPGDDEDNQDDRNIDQNDDQKHDDDQRSLEDGILKTRRKSKVPLEAVPYSEEYKDHLSKSADFLEEVKQFSSLRLVLILIFSLHYDVFAFVPFSFVAFQVSFTRLRTRRTTLHWPSFSELELRFLFLSN